MSATTSSARRALAAAALALLAACTEREVEVRPFAIQATLDGQPFAQGLFEIEGVATLDAPRALRVATLEGQTLAVSFSDAGGEEVVFPPDIGGRQVGIRLQTDLDHFAPNGEPVPVVAMHVIPQNDDGTFSYRLVLGEATYSTRGGLPALPAIFLPPLDEDFPRLSIFADSLYFEPTSCGLVYYDQLRITAAEVHEVARDETERVTLGLPPDWNVRNVLTWHRSGDCPDEVGTWTQVAMWR